ncbi:class I SAM-dependent methyltransferase [Nocardia sp. NBC_00508]|uniref:class I SAM-dependent methyltransferase n=1 Tax=Nocardia sp. NBC_00508 TaxID=2975992 RepID=UPI002E7FE4C1|nr:class I SAM-dependent methyltransferase [Nocardia sp. NBC_00508]WUD67938.1 class I SAM-dependent methyltransferase [Nocardia sp. NBC_00508]
MSLDVFARPARPDAARHDCALGLFDQAMTGAECWMRTADGARHRLPTRRWLGHPNSDDRRADAAITHWCDGPTLDLGCGPGRLVAALLRRGVVALGVDISPMAVGVTRFRGAPALQRDLFGHLPGTGRWSYAILADGNIGIGGDPQRVLARTAELLADAGVAIVEFDPPRAGFDLRPIRLETRTRVSAWIPWARVGIDHAHDLSAATGFHLITTAEVSGRHFAWLRRISEVER